MLTSWRKRREVAAFYAAKGKGVPIPYSGRNRFKPGPKWFDDMPGNWFYRWKSKNRTKLSNRDRSRMGDTDGIT
ncbi:hypothetical protein ACVWZ4_007230 [Bradyrhizobium sp. USDA 4472]